MSSLIYKKTSAEPVPANVQTDYVPQHPMLAFKGPKKVAATDHLCEYSEVDPFEDSEGLMSGLKWMGKKASSAAKSLGKKASKVYESGKKLLSGKKKEDADQKEEDNSKEEEPKEE